MVISIDSPFFVKWPFSFCKSITTYQCSGSCWEILRRSTQLTFISHICHWYLFKCSSLALSSSYDNIDFFPKKRTTIWFIKSLLSSFFTKHVVILTSMLQPSVIFYQKKFSKRDFKQNLKILPNILYLQIKKVFAKEDLELGWSNGRE